jgi:hypothetical protein
MRQSAFTLLRAAGRGPKSLRRAIARSQIAATSAVCSAGDLSWTALFMVTMLWGYGDRDKAGPTKLFLSLTTPKADSIIRASAEHVRGSGDFLPALDEIWKLDQCGFSYGTKWLFAVGLSCPYSIRPLVMDSNVAAALCELRGRNLAEALYGVSAWRRAEVKAGYARYCADMGNWAAVLKCRSDQIERFLYENSSKKRISRLRD